MNERSPLTLDDLVALPHPYHAEPGKGAESPDLSADGRQVVYVDQGSLWLVGIEGGEPRRLTEGNAPRWSPVGEEIAFLRGQPAQVWIRDAAGEERPVTHLPAGATGYAWSPDGRRIATTGPAAPAPAADSEKPAETIIEVHRRPPLPPGHELRVTDRDTGASRLVATAEPGVVWSYPAWSPDGRRIALNGNSARVTQYLINAEETHHLVVVDLERGAARYPAGRGRRVVGVPAWSPDGTRLALPYSPHEFLHPWRWELGVVAASGGEVRCFAGDYFVDYESVCWHPDGRTVYCEGRRGSTVQLLRVDTVTGAVTPLTDAPGEHNALRISRDGRWLVCTFWSPTQLDDVYLIATDGRERRPLTRISQARLGRFRLSDVEIVQWQGTDGLELEGVLVKPLEYQPGRRYPLFVDLHPGPVCGGMAQFYPEYHWMAAQGYLVFAPDFRSGQTYGWCPPIAEAEPGYEEWDFRDIMAGVDGLISAGHADADRLAVHGFSHGAGLINRILGRTDRFKAAVAVAGGVSSEEVRYGMFLGGNPILAGEMGGRPWEVPEVYARHNPLNHLHNARTPTLILNGAHDEHLNDTGASVLYTWLYQLGAEVEYVIYRGEGHTISKPEHRKDCWRRILAWLDRHLASAEL